MNQLSRTKACRAYRESFLEPQKLIAVPGSIHSLTHFKFLDVHASQGNRSARNASSSTALLSRFERRLEAAFVLWMSRFMPSDPIAHSHLANAILKHSGRIGMFLPREWRSDLDAV